MHLIKWTSILGLFLVLFSCQRKNDLKSIIDFPKGFSSFRIPADHEITKEKIVLGERLFFDPRLSKEGNISCASCHKPELAFADSLPISQGTHGDFGFRNAPSIVNTAYKTVYHADGGVRSLELQTLAPIIDPREMGNDFNGVLKFLQSDSEYVSLFKSAFDSIPSVFGLTRAIAAYERTLIFGNSPYDQFLNGDSAALSTSQKRGLFLFESNRLQCSKCHSGVLLTDYSFQNIGMEPQFEDSGRARITYQPEDANKFVTPSLRNVAITSPYMHNGSMKTLEEVIVFLENGGGSHPNKSTWIQPFELTAAEKLDLISFLESLTDSRWKKN